MFFLIFSEETEESICFSLCFQKRLKSQYVFPYIFRRVSMFFLIFSEESICFFLIFSEESICFFLIFSEESIFFSLYFQRGHTEQCKRVNKGDRTYQSSS